MHLLFQRTEGESTLDDFGKVPDDVMGRIVMFWANRELTGKTGTIEQMLGALSDFDMTPYRERLREYFTSEIRKPKDILLRDCVLCRLDGGFNIRWDFTDEFKERMKKRNERRDRKLKEELEAIRSKKQKGG